MSVVLDHYQRQSCNSAAALLLGQLHGQVSEAMFEQRVKGAVKAHESFDGLLAEHVLALEEVRDMLRETLTSSVSRWGVVARATDLLDDQIAHVRNLGPVAEKQEAAGGD